MPNSAHNRKDPQKGKKEFSTNKGFTVIELLIAVAVLAIITSLALPSYRAILEKRQVTSGTEQIAAFLSAAQLEAVKRNLPVEIKCTVENCSATALADYGEEESILLRTLEFTPEWAAKVEAVLYDPNDGQVIFDPIRGMLVNEDVGPSPLEIQLASPENMYALNIRMAATGRITICNNVSAEKSVPGYEDCWGVDE